MHSWGPSHTQAISTEEERELRQCPGQPRTRVEKVGQQCSPKGVGSAAYPITRDEELGAAVSTAARRWGTECGRHHAFPRVRLSPQLGLPALHLLWDGMRADTVLQVDAVVE